METKIDLLGIVRNTSPLNSPAGACQELVNLRKKYGSWRPILPKLAVKTNFASSTNVFIHVMEEDSYFITYFTDGTLKALTNQGVVIETLATLTAGHTIKFSSLGDFLIVRDITTYEKYIFRCSPDAVTKYTNVSDIPFINLTLSAAAPDPAVTTSYLTKLNNDDFQAGWWLMDSYFRSIHPQYFEGFVFLRWGIELIDGTVLKHSQPVFLYVGDITSTLGVDYVTLESALININYTIQAALPADWANYSNLIRGVSVFMTKPISKYDLERSGFTVESVYLGLEEKSTLLVDLFRGDSAYYRVHHIPYNKIEAAGTGIVGSSKPVITESTAGSRRTGASSSGRSGGVQVAGHRDSPSVLSSRYNTAESYDQQRSRDFENSPLDITSYEMLSVDDVSHHRLIGIMGMNYNSRLYLGDIYTRLYDGYNIANIVIPSGNNVTEFDIYVEVDLATNLGLRTLRQTMKSTKDAILIPYILAYPDIRATQIRILHNSGGALKKMLFPLESHPSLNLAFANKKNAADITVAAKDTDGWDTVLISAITTAATLATLDESLRDKNRIQLTELYNPFIYPSIYSYQVGEGDIIGLAVNMLPLDDKFGSFPVFVFTSRGVYALNLSDTGAVVVSNIVSVSASVCINSDSILQVDDFIVFLASDGVKLLTGRVPSEISDLAEGPSASILTGNTVYTEIIGKAVLNAVTNQLSSTDILSYAAGAVFGYDKNLREIIVSDYSKEYSYIYSLDEKIWYKCSQRFRKFINNFPDTYALSTGNDLVDISKEQTAGNIGLYLETRPLLLNPDKEVKILRVILGGKFDIATSFYGALYLFGSNDGVTWHFIQGKEVNGLSVYNIILPRMNISLRYVVAIFTGTVTRDSSISEFRLTI